LEIGDSVALSALLLLGATVLDVIDTGFPTDDAVVVSVLRPVRHASSPPFLHEFARRDELVGRELPLLAALALATAMVPADALADVLVVR
jgi:hypothetical protein